MKKILCSLFFCLLLSSGVQANTPNGLPENRNEGDHAMSLAHRLVGLPYADAQPGFLPAIQTIRTETKLAGMSSAQTKRGVVKADFDEEEGQVDWKTALIVLGVAFLVYWINRSKRHDMD